MRTFVFLSDYIETRFSIKVSKNAKLVATIGSSYESKTIITDLSHLSKMLHDKYCFLGGVNLPTYPKDKHCRRGSLLFPQNFLYMFLEDVHLWDGDLTEQKNLKNLEKTS